MLWALGAVLELIVSWAAGWRCTRLPSQAWLAGCLVSSITAYIRASSWVSTESTTRAPCDCPVDLSVRFWQVRNEIQRTKIEMANEVIDAGR